MLFAEYRFEVSGGQFKLVGVDVDNEIKMRILDASYDCVDSDFTIVGFEGEQIQSDFCLWYQNYLDFSPSKNGESNVKDVSFEAKGSAKYGGDTTAKCRLYFRKKVFFALNMSSFACDSNGFELDNSKIFKIPNMLLTDLSDVMSKFEFSLEYDGSNCSCVYEVIKVKFQFVE